MTGRGSISEDNRVPALARARSNEGISRVKSYLARILSGTSLEILTAGLLGLAAVASSWSSYQATRWSGLQVRYNSQASGLRVESTRVSTLAAHVRTIDGELFSQWLNALEAKKTSLARFYRKRFREEFVPAFEAWMAHDPLKNAKAPPSPFAMPDYRLSLDAKVAQLDSEAARASLLSQQANEQGDLYVLNSVVLAVAMFFAGMAQQFKKPAVRASILGVGLTICVAGLYRIATYPVA